MKNEDAWPALPYVEWAPTLMTLQMVTQMIGKVRLSLAPPQPEWLNACLYLDGRGFTTGAIPYRTHVLSIGIDVYDSAISIRVSDGRGATVPLGTNRSVADIWTDLRAAMAGLDIVADVWEKPQETADTTPFSENKHDRTIEPAHAQGFYRVLCAVDGVFEQFRSSFFGRSSVQFWWGAFDFCVLLFSGRRAAVPDDAGYIMRYDLDAEHMNAGFWPGDDKLPRADFYAYIVPRPAGCEVAPIRPAPAAWEEAMGEWRMPYDQVRTSGDPRAALLAFLESVYAVAVTNGQWEAESHRYPSPLPPPRR
jgi:hypothetical protein